MPTQLLKNGLYEFNADNDTVRVFSGKAAAREANKWVDIKGDHQLTLSADAAQKAQHFGKDSAKDELYTWSSLRSEYLSEANGELAGYYHGGIHEGFCGGQHFAGGGMHGGGFAGGGHR